MRRPVALFALLFLGGASAWILPRTAPLVEGRVTSPDQAPIASARVELRSGEVLLTADRTDADGQFELETDDPWGPDLRIRAERLGYSTIEIAVPEALGPIEIVLEPAPLPLPGFEVVGERESCSRDPEPDARRLWASAAERHWGGLDTVGVASYTRIRTDTLTGQPQSRVGIEGAVSGQRASAPLLRLNWDRRVDREGYAFRVRRTDSSRSYDSWGYPPLEADFASHFGSATFGERHDFLFEARVEASAENPIQRRNEGWIVYFCPRDDDEPYMDGMLEIGPDSLIRRVEWRFHTPEPNEDAGGWALFPPANVTDPSPPLLPSESVTWKTLPDGNVLREAQWYEGWAIAEGDSVPFLPRRNEDGDAPLTPSGPTVR